MDPSARQVLSLALHEMLQSMEKGREPAHRRVTVVCVGSDRSTGDSLGPLVGSRLEKAALPGLVVRGTLEDPVHAANLAEHVAHLKQQSDQMVVGIDACLGKAENVGTVCIKRGPLRPGTGVNKDLPAIGQLHIVGVVNVGGFMEYFVLQNTRLSLVIRLADLIAESVIDAFSLWNKDRQRRFGADVAATLEE